MFSRVILEPPVVLLARPAEVGRGWTIRLFKGHVRASHFSVHREAVLSSGDAKGKANFQDLQVCKDFFIVSLDEETPSLTIYIGPNPGCHARRLSPSLHKS